MITRTKFGENKFSWVDISTENRAELKELYREYDIDNEVIDYSLDKNERARIEYDQLSNTLIIIFNVPNREKINNHYETIPITFILQNSTPLTITNKKNSYVKNYMVSLLSDFPNINLLNLLFTTLFKCTDFFFPYIEDMDEDRVKVDRKLREKTSKQNLLLLSDLETGIVYFVSASKQNVVLLQQLRTHVVYKMMNESEKEQLEDVLIEAKQLVEMTHLLAQILQQLSSAYNDVLNNSLNETMRILTVFSVLLTIPTIVTGFFGMNMPLPLEHNQLGWLVTIAVSGLIWIIIANILKRWMS